MEKLIQDLRYGARILISQPGVSLIAIVALAVSIGANTAIFTVVNEVLLKALPFSNADRVVMVWNKGVPAAGGDRTPLALLDVLDWRASCTSCEQVAAFGSGFVNYTGGEVPEQVRVATVTANFFSALGAQPLLGRTFLPGEEKPGAPRVAVVSERFWRQRLGADPRVIDRAIDLSGVSYTIVGIVPRAFDFPSKDVDIWPALRVEQPSRRGPYFLTGVALLNQDSSPQQAQLQMNTVKSSIGGEMLNPNVLPIRDFIVGDVRPALLLLLVAVSFVVLIAGTNVANLLLVRATGREREIAIRAALGATRWRIIRQLLTESVLLSSVGGLSGLLIASWGVSLLLSIAPDTLPRAQHVAIDGTVLAWTALVSLGCGLVFGLAPALQVAELKLSETLKEGSRAGTEGAGKRRLRSLLIVSEVSLAMMLMVSAGLVIKSFWRLQRVDSGLSSERVLTAQIRLPRSRYQDGTKINNFYDSLLARLSALTEIETVAISGSLPPDELQYSDNFSIEGIPTNESANQVADMILVSPGYFQTIGLPLRSGRVFTSADTADAPQVVLINETMAHRYFSGEDSIGKRIRQGQDPTLEIVGVVADAKYEGLESEIQPAIYQPAVQNPSGSMFLIVKTRARDPRGVVGALRQVLASLDPELPLAEITTANELMRLASAQQRFRTTLIGTLAIVALLLASVGIYGVISYSVSRRTHEIGIRMALGARGSSVIKLVFRQVAAMVLTGVALGLAGSASASRILASLLFEVSPTDLSVFAGVAVLLLMVALGACLVPAMRATRVDPLTALRYE